MLQFTGYLLLLLHLSTTPSSSTVDFLFNSFNTTDLLLISDAQIDSSVIRLTNDSKQFSTGRAFYPTQLTMRNTTANSTSSFSTTFIFSILPINPTNPGFGFAFVLSNSTSPSGALSGQYFGLFSNATTPFVAPLLAVEFDTGRNPEFNDPVGNHIGIDLNNIESDVNASAGYWNNATDFQQIEMNTGQNIRAWIEFDGAGSEINVTIAPAGNRKPQRPLIAYRNPAIADYISDKMYVGFSASKVTWVEAQRILAWSLSNNGAAARELDTSSLPVFLPESPSSSSPSKALIAGVSLGTTAFLLLSGGLMFYWLNRRRNRKKKEEDAIEDWELEYWPHRFTHGELHEATKGFCKEQLLGFGGFGKVYKGVLTNNAEIAVKCVSHNSKQGLREFIAEISSMGRLQHRSLVQMRGWCRKGNELMLAYDFMPNGSLNKCIFDNPGQLLGWDGRRQVLVDVAEGLLYLHHGWDQVVLHRDIKSSNILLDANMRGRLGDFGLARLYQHGQAPNSTRIVGTLGYLAPELAQVSVPTTSSDVYSFGVVMLEVASGRRPIETWTDDEPILIDWVSDLYVSGRLLEAADPRIGGEYNAEDMEMVLKLGLACCHPEPEHRPTMKQVAALLLGEEAVVVPSALLSDLTRTNDLEEEPTTSTAS